MALREKLDEKLHSVTAPLFPLRGFGPPLQLIELFIEVEVGFGLGKLTDTMKHKSLRKSPDQLIFH